MEIQIQYIPLENLHLDENQPRESLDRNQIDSIKLSILEKGYIEKYFVDVVHLGNGDYLVQNGAHRMTASKELAAEGKFSMGADGTASIPALIHQYDGDTANFRMEQVLDNNVKPMTPYEIIKVAQEALEAGNSIVKVARSMGISPSVLRADLPIGNLPPEILTVFKAGNLPKVVARKLAEYPANRVLTAWSWAKNGENADKMMAGMKKYDEDFEKKQQKKLETQTDNAQKTGPETKDVICEWNSKAFSVADARKFIERMEKAVANVANCPLGNGYSQFAPKAVRGNVKKLRVITSQMITLSKKINESCDMFEAEKASA